MKNKLTVILFMIFIALGSSACTKFHGRVIDADTRQPIEGAVVVVSWREERGTPTGPSSRLKDVKEVLTDKNGEWSIRGPKGTRNDCLVNTYTFFTCLFPGTHFTNPPDFIVFKPGYCSYPKGYFIDACKEKMKPYGIGEGETMELPRLTSREDRWRNLPRREGFSRTFDKKQINFLKLIDEERNNLFGERDLQDYIKELENEK